jgi:hypothetical protein
MCTGFWVTILVLHLKGFYILDCILYAGLGSFTAEIVDRKLWNS